MRDRTYVRERRKAPGKVYTYARGRKHKEVTPASHIRTDDLVSTAPTVRPLRHDAGVILLCHVSSYFVIYFKLTANFATYSNNQI